MASGSMRWSCHGSRATRHAVRPTHTGRVRIVLRGSSFAFRKTVFRTRDRRNFGAAFALSSVLVPYCMGAIAGAIASGRVPAGARPVIPGPAG